MKKMLLTVVLVATMLVGCSTKTTDDTTVNNNNNVIDVTTTMYDCYDKEQFKGNVRIEQMFVDDVVYSEEEGEYNVVTLVDTTENYWTVENIDLFLDEDVLVLMVDNGTPKDITDDVIVHCWVGLE